jgi:flagellar protein FlaI
VVRKVPDKLLKSYLIKPAGSEVNIKIVQEEDAFVKTYFLDIPEFGEGTQALLNKLRRSLVLETQIKVERMMDPEFIAELRQRFADKAKNYLKKQLPRLSEKDADLLILILVNDMVGLGDMEFLLEDPNLEEIVINSAKEPIWVYHKEFGWLRTTVNLKDEAEILNYASVIARRVGKQITILDPLLDAHLITGDRANATLFPISGTGNTLTIRRFRREPWTVTDLIKNKTVSSPLMALIWVAMQYEMNIILSGGTASGKTSFLNVCIPFIQPNNRILTIEDTREITLPDFMHWVPLTTREPNPEGKGAVPMLDLLVNSLRMRPDRIIVGEIRRQREAEVMFEAMHTGHSVYTTFHANTAQETVSRMTNPPISVPPTMLEAVHLNVVMFRNRRLGIRRVLEVAEFVPEKRGTEAAVKVNTIYRWHPSQDTIEKHNESIRFSDELALHTGFTRDEIASDISSKQNILDWMVKNNLHKIGDVGRIFARYYSEPDEVVKLAESNKLPPWLKK